MRYRFGGSLFRNFSVETVTSCLAYMTLLVIQTIHFFFAFAKGHTKVKFRRRTSHEPNRMQMRENKGFCSFAFDSAHVKYINQRSMRIYIFFAKLKLRCLDKTRSDKWPLRTLVKKCHITHRTITKQRDTQA